MKKEKRSFLSIIMIGIMMIGLLVGCGSGSGNASSATDEVQQRELASYKHNSNASDEENDAANAAVTYVNVFHDSKQAVMNQLSGYDGYSEASAQYAVDNITVDWNEVAVASAKSYLESSNLSKQGVFDQLTSSYGSQFTPEEAQYAIDHLDVDWKKEALGAAKSYLSTGSFSEQGLLDQLTSSYADEFTPEEARYALENIDADWNAEALEAAESYYDTGMTDKTEIFNQITSQYADKFTPQQAQYTIDHLDPTKLDAQ